MLGNRQFSSIFNQFANGLHFQVQLVVLIKKMYTFIRLKQAFNVEINQTDYPLQLLLHKSCRNQAFYYVSAPKRGSVFSAAFADPHTGYSVSPAWVQALLEARG